MSHKKKQIKIPLYLQILFGMIGGILLGMIALQWGNGTAFVHDWIYPWGRLFIRLLQLIAMPLVVVSLINGVIGLKDVSRFSRLGSRALIFFLATTILAVSIGLSIGLLVKPGELVDKTKIEHI
ncbi:MAG: dicarboxylate/amino acid:cation symporter, partial [Dysgonamonadaceae bacterium]|nr:dicarboxylate/amino acid:cation symporter [Dysgonamonadaceae bacterium]